MKQKQDVPLTVELNLGYCSEHIFCLMVLLQITQMKKILITGGTGMIGRALEHRLKEAHFQVHILSRFPSASNEFYWNYKTGEIDENAFEGVDAIIHLAGANIGSKRWSRKRKKVIIDSRTETTELLMKKLSGHSHQVKKVIAASAIGYYGMKTLDKVFKEEDEAGTDFSGQVCDAWEKAADQFAEINIPVTKLRIGVVLADQGGAWLKLKNIARYNLAAPLGNGSQWIPWIHLDDLVELFIFSLKNDAMNGVYNAVADEHIRQQQFMKSMAKKMNRLFIPIPVPAIILKWAMGEMAAMILYGSRISNQKIKDAGFVFKYSSLEKAFEMLN